MSHKSCDLLHKGERETARHKRYLKRQFALLWMVLNWVSHLIQWQVLEIWIMISEDRLDLTQIWIQHDIFCIRLCMTPHKKIVLRHKYSRYLHETTTIEPVVFNVIISATSHSSNSFVTQVSLFMYIIHSPGGTHCQQCASPAAWIMKWNKLSRW